MNIGFRTAKLGSFALGTLIWLACGNAQSQQAVSSARDLFKQARALTTEGNFSEACPIFEKSLALENGLGTQFNLADCWEHVGRAASAYRLFLSVAEAASEKSEADRAKLAVERAVALAPKLSRLQIRYDRSGGELRVSREHVPIEQFDWNRPTAIDPGHYTVELVSNGAVKWTADVDVPARALTVLVTLPSPGKSRLAVEMASEPKTVPEFDTPDQVVASSKPVPQAPTPAPTSDIRRTTNIWPPVALLAGIGGVGVGTVFALVYQSKNDQAKSICPDNVNCSDSDIQQHDSLVSAAKAARLGAYLGIGLGTASIAAATVYYVTRPANREYHPPVSLDVSPLIEPGRQMSFGAVARGTF